MPSLLDLFMVINTLQDLLIQAVLIYWCATSAVNLQTHLIGITTKSTTAVTLGSLGSLMLDTSYQTVSLSDCFAFDSGVLYKSVDLAV